MSHNIRLVILLIEDADLRLRVVAWHGSIELGFVVARALNRMMAYNVAHTGK